MPGNFKTPRKKPEGFVSLYTLMEEAYERFLHNLTLYKGPNLDSQIDPADKQNLLIAVVSSARAQLLLRGTFKLLFPTIVFLLGDIPFSILLLQLPHSIILQLILMSSFWSPPGNGKNNPQDSQGNNQHDGPL
jgi:hypothetical protein